MGARLRDSHPVFDVESQIVNARNQPSPVDLKPWQDRLDKIAGKTTDGKSRLRIVWGQDYGLASMISCGKRRLKYPFWRYEDGGEIHDIGIPRFFVEELHLRAELERGDGWERSRWYWDDATGEMIDVLGPLPEEGFYTALFQIASHGHLCCDGRGIVKHEPCLGAYRPPTDTDLQRVRRAKQRRDQASNDDNAPSESLLRKRAASMTAERDEKWRQNIRGEIDDYFKTRSHSWFTLDPAPYSWGKYHFMGGHSKSGLEKEDINASSGNAYENWARSLIRRRASRGD